MRRAFAIICSSNIAAAAALGLLLVPLEESAAKPRQTAAIVDSKSVAGPAIELREGDEPCTETEFTCTSHSASAQEWAYPYLVKTAHPGGTMMRQGPEVAIGRLHPEFASRLAAAIREAREVGLTEAGIFSAYRPPAFGVGGFSDKFSSLHAYGLAVDMHGIGAPGSSQAKLWHKVAAKHGVACPYGVNNRAEWNHCQPTRVKVIRSDSPLRNTIAADGPRNPFGMFEAGKALIESVATLFTSFGAPPEAGQRDRAVALASQRVRRIRTADTIRVRRIRTADTIASRQDRHGRRVSGRKGHAKKILRTAAASGKARTVKHSTRQRTTSMVRRAQRASSSQVN